MNGQQRHDDSPPRSPPVPIPTGKDDFLTIPDDPNRKRGISGGWVVDTRILADLLNGVEPRPFFTTHARIKQDYEALV